jgi:transposase InsO family protein
VSASASVATGRRYGLQRVCRVWQRPRSTVYAARAARKILRLPKKRGPKTALSDEELLQRIRTVLASSPWLGEGYRKVWARLRFAGTRTGRPRVLRLMRTHGLLAPTRRGSPRGPSVHDGTIIPERPDVMWGTDATCTLATTGQPLTVFGVIDHATGECLALHAADNGRRWEAIEALRDAVRDRHGIYGPGLLPALKLRHDHGSCFLSRAFQAELRFLQIESSPAFVRTPEGNGCIERFFRTLKEQLLWQRRFGSVAELQAALQAFRETYNSQWLLARHGHLTPRQARERLAGQATAA